MMQTSSDAQHLSSGGDPPRGRTAHRVEFVDDERVHPRRSRGGAGDDPSHGVEFVEHLPLQHRRASDPVDRRRHDVERQDAATFAKWGIDYLKYDLCTPNLDHPEQVRRFTAMRDALRATGRPIVYSINPNSFSADDSGSANDWSEIANQWRISQDIQPFWDTSANRPLFGWGVLDILDIDAALSGRAGPGHWNDPDMLVVDVAILNGRIRLMPEQARSHLTMWAMTAAPLLAGNDVRSMSAETKSILLNRDVLDIDQDALGLQAERVQHTADFDVWARRLAGGARAVALLNRTDKPLRVAATTESLHLVPGHHSAKHLWTGDRVALGTTIEADLKPFETALFRTDDVRTADAVTVPSGRDVASPRHRPAPSSSAWWWILPLVAVAFVAAATVIWSRRGRRPEAS